MPTYNRGECACCGGGIISCYTYGASASFTHNPTYSTEVGGVTYYYFYYPYSGTLEPGAYIVYRIEYQGGAYRDVNVPITDADIVNVGLNTLEISPLTFTDGGYQFTTQGTFRIAATNWNGGSDTTCTHDFSVVANAAYATWTPIS